MLNITLQINYTAIKKRKKRKKEKQGPYLQEAHSPCKRHAHKPTTTK